MGCTYAMRSQLETLPGELQDQILSLLATEPPSAVQFHRRPSGSLSSGQNEACFKALSCCSKRMRSITLPHLFSNAVVTLKAWDDFISFCERHQLQNSIKSIVAVLSECEADGEDVGTNYYSRFSGMVQTLPCLTSMTVLCPPAQFFLLTGMPAYNIDAWNFNMPYHAFRLDIEPLARRRQVLDIAARPIMEVLPWSSFSLNEGSFLCAYTQYEYFLRQPPTILIAARMSPGHPQLDSTFLQGLRSFSYTAIFPFYNHIGNVLNLISRSMPNLENLSMCLSPHPDEYDAVSAKERKESSGKIDYHDAWMELETSYELVAHHVLDQGRDARLKTFKSIDWDFGGEVRKITESRIKNVLEQPVHDDLANSIWHHAGAGVWQIGPGRKEAVNGVEPT